MHARAYQCPSRCEGRERQAPRLKGATPASCISSHADGCVRETLGERTGLERMSRLSRIPMLGLFVLQGSAPQAQWRLEQQPFLSVRVASERVGGDGSATGASLLRDGRIVVADNVQGVVHLWDASGRRVRSVGRRGAGPGEFQLISWLGNCGGDSIFVWDFGLRRMTVLSSFGRILRQFTIPLRRTDGSPPYRLACSKGGRLAALLLPEEQSAPRHGSVSARSHVRVVTLDSRGNRQREWGQVLGDEYVLDRNGAMLPRPLGEATYIAMSDEHLFLGESRSDTVSVAALGNDQRRNVPLGTESRPATQRHGEEAIRALVSFANDPDIRERMEQLLKEAPMPSQLPRYSGLHSDPEGNLWTVMTTAGDSATRLLVHSSSGELLARLELPHFLQVFEVGSTYVLGRYAPAGRGVRVAAFRLHRPATARAPTLKRRRSGEPLQRTIFWRRQR